MARHIPIAPVPFAPTHSITQDPSGESWLVIDIENPTGNFVMLLHLDDAISWAESIIEDAKQGKTGLIVPPSSNGNSRLLRPDQ